MRRAEVHNAITAVVGALLFFVLWVAVERSSTPMHQPAWAAVVSSSYFHALLGGALYFVFRGRPWVRVALVIAIPLASGLIFEVLLGSDPAYPYIALLFAGLAAVAFFIGATLVAGLSWAASRKHAKQAT